MAMKMRKPEIIGNYTVVEARNSVHDKENAIWRVYYRQAPEPMSEHPTLAAARAAAARYDTADIRRGKIAVNR